MSDKKPLRRHPNLQPLSRDHHRILVLAQLLKYDVPDYRGLPDTLAEKAEYTLEFYDTFLNQHFLKEEEMLVPLVSGFDPLLDRYGEQLREEHQRIRSILDGWRSAPPNGSALDQLGRYLEENIRFEERIFFEHLQKMTPPEVLAGLHLDF